MSERPRRRSPEPATRKPKKKKGGGWLLLVLGIGIPLLVTFAGCGVVGYFALRWTGYGGLGGGDREDLVNRLEGEWHADDPEHDGVYHRLNVRNRELHYSVKNSASGAEISDTFAWEVVRHAPERLVIRTKSKDGNVIDWTFDFKDDNEVTRTVTKDKVRKHVFRRLVKVPPREQRDEQIQKCNKRLEGKWQALLGDNATRVTIDFGQDGTLGLVFKTNDGKEEKYAGRYRIVWVVNDTVWKDSEEMRIKVEGLDNTLERIDSKFLRVDGKDKLQMTINRWKGNQSLHIQSLHRPE